MDDVAEQMRADWNRRAREDAHYYVAFGGRHQDEEAFLATATEVVNAIRWELKRLPVHADPRTRRALEIGCGPGRLIKRLSPYFGEIHGVDVSDEMIRIARDRLRDIPHALVHATNGASLAPFASESFDIVYSYAVFQHVPSRDVVLEYMRETCRVLRPGGIFRGQFNGLSPTGRSDTWSGCNFSPQEIRDFTRANGIQLLALEGPHTQYMWTTWRKPTSAQATGSPPVKIRRITNASSSEAVVPNGGSQAAISVWTVHLPIDCDLNNLEVRVDGRLGDLIYIGPCESDGLRQVNAMLPPGTRTGLVPVQLHQAGHALGPGACVRVIPAGPLVPRILSLTDGIDIVEENRCTSGMLKMRVEEVAHPEQISADIDGRPVPHLEVFCTDPLAPRYEINFRLPSGVGPGRHQVRLHIGPRTLLPREIEVV